MPVHECQKDKKPGYQWGSGKCYTYNPNDKGSEAEALRKAHAQGEAARRAGYKE